MAEATTQHGKYVRSLLVDISADLVEPTPEVRKKWRFARKELPRILTEDDVPLLAMIMTTGDYRDWEKKPRGRTGWQPRVYVSEAEYERIQKNMWMAEHCALILGDYYIRTNSPAVRDAFLDILRRYEALHVSWLRLVLTIGHLPLLRPEIVEETEWVDAVHSAYLAFDNLEAQIEAASYMLKADKYKAEAVWFLCRVLSDPKMLVPQAAVERIAFLLGWERTRRTGAVFLAYGALAAAGGYLRDHELMEGYVIPWAKHIAAHYRGTEHMLESVLHPERSAAYPVSEMGIDVDAIPAGTPVPPKPPTVRSLPGARAYGG